MEQKTTRDLPTESVRISQLPSIVATDITDNDLIILNQTTGTKSVSFSELKQALYFDLIGTIQAFSFADTIPANFLPCNGQELLIAEYPLLFAKINNIYGIPSNGNNFVLPNLKDQFLRGANGTTRLVGTTQEDTMQKITGSFASTDDGDSNVYVRVRNTEGVFSSTKVQSNFLSSAGGSPSTNNAGIVSFDSSRVARHDAADETRPKNIAVVYCIKAK